jgi:hypothetical protein
LNQFDDLERVMFRRGDQHSAKFWRRVLLPLKSRDLAHQDDQDLLRQVRRIVAQPREPDSSTEGREADRCPEAGASRRHPAGQP